MRGFILNWNMIDLTSIFIHRILKNSTKLESQFSTCCISRIKCMFEIGVSRIFSCPSYQCKRCFSCISFSLFILSNPESEIHPMFLRTPETNSSYESIRSFFEDKILKYLWSLHSFYTLFYEIQFLLIRWQEWIHEKIFIRLAKFCSKLTDIYSTICRKWYKDTTRSLDDLFYEIEMWIREESHKA